jgi:hypothetical protein
MLKSKITLAEVTAICNTFNTDPVTKITTTKKQPQQKLSQTPVQTEGTFESQRDPHMVFRNTTILEKNMMLTPPSVTSLQVWEDGGYNCGMHEYYQYPSRTMKFHSDSAIDLIGSIAIIALTDGICIEYHQKGHEKRHVICLEIGDVCQFDLEFNSRHLHRLIFTKEKCRVLTLYRSIRTSDKVYFCGDHEAVTAFRRHRREENTTIMTQFPHIPYTNSHGDMSFL